MDTLYVCFTMDAERIREESPSGGPSSWINAEQSAINYAQIANDRGYPITYFIVPYAIKPLQKTWQTLRAKGNQCGLHFHPNSWEQNFNQPVPILQLGRYPSTQQNTWLNAAITKFTTDAGWHPEVFRPGCFSCTSETYPILTKLGIHAGSISLPGRNRPDWGANWIRARRDIYTPSLDFVEVPITANCRWNGYLALYGDTRFERQTTIKHIFTAIHQTIKWQIHHKSPVKHLCFLTHNTVCYDTLDLKKTHSKREIVQNFLNELPKEIIKYGLKPEGITIGNLARIYQNQTRYFQNLSKKSSN